MLQDWFNALISKWTSASVPEQFMAVAVAVFTYLVGEDSNELVRIALMFMATDITLGALSSMYKGEFNSKIMRKGILRKFGMIVAIIVAHLVDDWLGTGTAVKKFVCSAISGYEFLSNIEKLAIMKIKVFPAWLVNRFKRANLSQDAVDILDKVKDAILEGDKEDEEPVKNAEG